MCGRFSLAVSKERIKKKYGVQIEEEIIPNYNIAPTQSAYVIANNNPKVVQTMNWGLVPHWARDKKVGNNLINARSEGVSGKPSFRMPIRKNRCLVLADGFYEWRKEGRKRIPYRITLRDDTLLTMAGIWDTWIEPNSQQLYHSFAVMTIAPNKEMQRVHDRMPVIFPNMETQAQWLSNIDLETALNMLQTLKDDSLNVFPVSSKVNSVASNSPDLYDAVQLPPTLFDLDSF
jgi:putative SOS response-associated peptidase YedK